MRTKEEILKRIKELEEKLTCPKCGSRETRLANIYEFDFTLECEKCGMVLEGDDYDKWELEILKWVLGEN